MPLLESWRGFGFWSLYWNLGTPDFQLLPGGYLQMGMANTILWYYNVEGTAVLWVQVAESTSIWGGKSARRCSYDQLLSLSKMFSCQNQFDRTLPISPGPSFTVYVPSLPWYSNENRSTNRTWKPRYLKCQPSALAHCTMWLDSFFS